MGRDSVVSDHVMVMVWIFTKGLGDYFEHYEDINKSCEPAVCSIADVSDDIDGS
jgi:hypothetical protein